MSNITDKNKSAQLKRGTGTGPQPVPPDTPASSKWESQLIRSDPDAPNSHPLAILANAITAFRCCSAWRGVLAFDATAGFTVLLSPPPWSSAAASSFPREWTDNDDTLATNWLQHMGILVPTSIATAAVEAVARDHPFRPVYDYLTSLTWDGEPRIDYWLTVYMGAEPSLITETFGARFLLSAVARVFHPGCQVDTVLFLEGEQGIYKSTALKNLFGAHWFTDTLPDLKDKDSLIQLRGVWVVELAEGNAIQGHSNSKIKQFLACAVDRYRPPWGKRSYNFPRECVFAGTVNLSTWLHDETGGRRFWPVKVGWIEPDWISADRDQLWAEAVNRYQSGHRRGESGCYWLDSKERIQLAEDEQAARYVPDAWDFKISTYISTRPDTSVPEILEYCIKKPLADCGQREQNRVARSLRMLQWERYLAVLADGSRQWRYRRKVPL